MPVSPRIRARTTMRNSRFRIWKLTAEPPDLQSQACAWDSGKKSIRFPGWKRLVTDRNGGIDMKRSLLVAAGLAIALSVSAQNNPDENKEQKEKKEKANTEQTASPGQHQGAKSGMSPQQHETRQHAGMQTKQHEPTGAGDQPAAQAKMHDRTKVNEKTRTGAEAKQEGGAVRTTTVFRNGKQTSEHLTLRRSTRERTDVHFSIGTHPREWWLRTY